MMRWRRRPKNRRAKERAAKALGMDASTAEATITPQSALKERARVKNKAKEEANISAAREKANKVGSHKGRGTSFTRDHRRAPGAHGTLTEEKEVEKRIRKEEKAG